MNHCGDESARALGHLKTARGWIEGIARKVDAVAMILEKYMG
jgi:hypothetical protein